MAYSHAFISEVRGFYKGSNKDFKRTAKTYKVSDTFLRKITAPGYRYKVITQRKSSKRAVDKKLNMKRIKKLAAEHIEVRGPKGTRVVQPFGTAPKIKAELERRHGTSLSVSQIRKLAKDAGLVSKSRKRVTTLDPEHLEARRKLVQFIKARDITGDQILAVDESHVDRNEYGVPCGYVEPGQNPPMRERKDPRNMDRVSFFAGVSLGWKSDLVIFPKYKAGTENLSPAERRGFAVDGPYYRRQCLPKVVPHLKANPDLWLLQDGAKSHDAAGTSKYLQDKKLLDRVLPWSPCSPDWNPIESIWAEVKRRVSAKNPQDRDEVVQALKEAWDELPQSVIDAHLLNWRKKIDDTQRRLKEYEKKISK